MNRTHRISYLATLRHMDFNFQNSSDRLARNSGNWSLYDLNWLSLRNPDVRHHSKNRFLWIPKQSILCNKLWFLKTYNLLVFVLCLSLTRGWNANIFWFYKSGICSKKWWHRKDMHMVTSHVPQSYTCILISDTNMCVTTAFVW